MAKINLKSGGKVDMIAGAVITSGEMVKLGASATANKIIPATDGAGIFGVALTNGAINAWVSVAREGVFRFNAASGVNFAPTDVAYVATSTTIDKGSVGNKSCGIVVDKDPATAGEVFLQITPLDLCPVTTHAGGS